METNLTNLGAIFKQEGTSRFERYTPNLNPKKVAVDNRKLEDFIVYAQRYAKNVRFVNTEDEDAPQDETWESFFKDDIVLLIANIATRNVAAHKTTYDHLSTKFLEKTTIDHFRELATFVLSGFQRLNSWYYGAPTESSLSQDLRLYIKSYLRKELIQLKEVFFYLNQLENRGYTPEDFYLDLFDNSHLPEISARLKTYRTKGADGNDDFRSTILQFIQRLINRDNVWLLPDKQNTPLREHLFAGADQTEKLLNAAVRLNAIFESVFYATESISNSCQLYLNDTINNKNDHAPHVAFLVTFLKLFSHVQDSMNELPAKHLDFYYEEVLKIKKKAAVPDQVFVIFELAKGFTNGEVKKGAALAAGKDAKGRDLMYELDKDIVINKAGVHTMSTIFIEKDTQAPPLTYNYYHRVLLSAGVPTGSVNATWKLFGAPSRDDIGEIGFAIASTQFYLAKGERTVTVLFELEEDVTESQFDAGVIKLLLSGEKGWLTSDDPKNNIRVLSLKKSSDKILELQFVISILQSQHIVAYNPEVHPGGFNTIFPVLQCILKYPVQGSPGLENEDWQNKIVQLNILQRLRIIKTAILVQVGSISSSVSFNGVTDLLIENQESVLDPKKPFYPFTPLPKVGSTFYIGCKDLFYKPIDTLSLNIEWMLPDDFDSHYQSYLPPYDTNKFMASVSKLKNRYWQKMKDVSIIDVDTKSPGYKVIKLDLQQEQMDMLADDPFSVPAYDNSRKDGTLQLKLNYPDFGHTIYPQLITSAVMEKASSKSSSVDFYKIVKKELRDSTISIKLPDDIRDRNGPLRVVVYDVLERVNNDAQARTMMINGLGKLIRNVNGSNVIFKKENAEGQEETGIETTNATLVNDDNIIERFLGLLKRIRVISKDVHHDKDRETASDIIDDVKDKINSQADFIMPSDREMIAVISNETNAAITKTVINVVEELLELRKNTNTPPGPEVVSRVLRKEIDDANEVINDMIAKKIAIILSANEVPKPPYTPLINAISISYTSHKNSEDGGDQFFYITPFGVTEIDLLNKAPASDALTTKYIFPRSIVTNDPHKGEMQGMLFIGISNMEVSRNLSLLVQLADGTRLNDKEPPSLKWWYLRNSKWIPLNEDAIISDSTYGFQVSGILELSIPSDANNNNVLFNTSSLFWLCASVSNDTDAFPNLIAIKSQAAVATFKDRGNDPMHLALPLEAGRVKNLADKVPFVKRVEQPESSFNGRVSENQDAFYTRVSERLRHKGRAICNWDYERMVLEQFPFLYKVKCINNYHSGQFAVGHITLVPITDLRNKNYPGNDILFPKTNYLDLRAIEKFVVAKASPFVKVHAVNPQLDHVLINCKVRFHTGVDKGFYLQRLNDDLVQFLTPWATGDMEAISFSGKIFSSGIISFIDKREYVDYVAELVMRQYNDDDVGTRVFVKEGDQLTSLVETQVTTNHSILVSAPRHEIELIE
ncbi:hypothetical protein EXU57_06650 [Segetibacter sp. 3557_3]|uniref:hypothetical protein n=1 Tax=Segetibacter sp. 3557_3 TaxID=2547429 RepID=UPI001058648D|nr:hypothetical protein [Segetibacter sp. 3557_3]TDH27264.1 hypothetical protein EXU57_06650 [Segetibacter sp. 3557_3]